MRLADEPEAPKRHPRPHRRAAASSSETTPSSATESGAAAPSPDAKKNAEDEDSEPKSKDDDGDGIFGPFRIGGLVGAGLPSLLSFGGILKLTRYFGAGVNVGLIPAVKLSYYGEAQISYQEYDLYGRLFPFGGALFVGAGVGYATMNGSFKNTPPISDIQKVLGTSVKLPNGVTIDSEGSVRTLVLIPTVGLLHTFGSGFTVGLDVGLQMPIAPSKTHFETRVPPVVPKQIYDQFEQQIIKPNDKKVQDTLDTVGRTILPTLNFRIGWLF